MDQSICRACLEVEAAVKFTPIFANNGELAQKIYQLADLIITEFEGLLSALMCSRCIQDLDEALRLKKMLVDNNNAFLLSSSTESKIQKELQLAKESMSSKQRAPKRKSSPSPCIEPKFGKNIKPNLQDENSDYFDDIEIKQEVFDDELESAPHSPDFLVLKAPEPTPYDDAQKIQCVICEREFSRKSYLIQHIRATHENDNHHKCTTCGKKFKTEKILQHHMTKHLIEKPYKCGLCTKSYSHKFDMKRHEMGHFNVNRYNCDYCSHGFARKDHLMKHRKTHLRRN